MHANASGQAASWSALARTRVSPAGQVRLETVPPRPVWRPVLLPSTPAPEPEAVATGEVPSLVRPFALDRFYEDRLVGEKAAAAVSH